MQTIQKIIDQIIAREGGFVDHPADRGGATNFGITIPALSVYLAREVCVEEIKNLSKETAFDIYHRQYYLVPKISQLPSAYKEIMLDMSVNHGPQRAIKILQKVINQTGRNISVDGLIGSKTCLELEDIANSLGKKSFTKLLIDERIRFYEAIVKNDETQRVFLAGWVSRAESFRPKPEQQTTMSIDPKSDHYDAGGIEVIEVIRAKLTPEQLIGYYLGNAIKYSLRLNHKGTEQRDAEKLKFYSGFLNDVMAKDLATIKNHD